MEPVRFIRSKGSTAVGCLTYALGGPVIAVALSMFAGALIVEGLKALGVPEDVALGTALVAVIGIFIGTLVFAVRDFRRRAGMEVVVHDDRLELIAGTTPDCIAFASLEAVLLKSEGGDLACVLIPAKGKRRRLPVDIASYTRIRPVFEARVIPVLRRRIEELLASGRPVKLGENIARAHLRILQGILSVPLGLLLIVTIKHALSGIRMIQEAPRTVRLGWRGRHGGIEIRSGGIAPCGGLVRKTIPWEGLSLESFDEDGVLLSTRRGGTLAITPFAENYWPGAPWVGARLSNPAKVD